MRVTNGTVNQAGVPPLISHQLRPRGNLQLASLVPRPGPKSMGTRLTCGITIGWASTPDTPSFEYLERNWKILYPSRRWSILFYLVILLMPYRIHYRAPTYTLNKVPWSIPSSYYSTSLLSIHGTTGYKLYAGTSSYLLSHSKKTPLTVK